MCYAHSIHIKIIDCETSIVNISHKGKRCPMLVSSDFSTHSAVLNAVAGEGDGGATISNYFTAPHTITYPEAEFGGTLLDGVCHVYIRHPHPTPCGVAAVSLHVTVDLGWLSSSVSHPVVA